MPTFRQGSEIVGILHWLAFDSRDKRTYSPSYFGQLSLVASHQSCSGKPSQHCEQYTQPVNRQWMQRKQIYMLEAHGADVERIRVAYDETTTMRN